MTGPDPKPNPLENVLPAVVGLSVAFLAVFGLGLWIGVSPTVAAVGEPDVFDKLTLILNAIGVGALAVTLYLTAKATTEAVRANADTKLHVSLEQRPWVAMSLRKVVQRFNASNLAEVTIKYDANNSGLTPAMNAVFYARLIRVSHLLKADDVLSGFVAERRREYSTSIERRAGVIFPNEKVDTGEQWLTEDALGMQERLHRHHWLVLCLCYKSSMSDSIMHTAKAYHVELVAGDHSDGSLSIMAGDEVRPFNGMGLNSVS